VISVDSGGLLLAPCASCEGSEIPKAHIVRLQVSAGHTGRTYALEGAIAGTIVGVVLGHANGERHRHPDPGGNDLGCTNSCAVTAGELVGGILGVVIVPFKSE
jgi:hypothetical protein